MSATIRRTILFTALSLANLLVIWSPDVLPNSLFAWTVLREGNVDYDEFTRPPLAIQREAYFFRACGVSTFTGTPSVPRSSGGPPPPGPADHVCSVFPPGAALLALPAFAPLVVAMPEPSDLGVLIGVGKLVGALEEGLAAALLVALLLPLAGRRWAIGLALLYLLATGVRTTSSQALWQHGAVHLAEIAALAILVPLFRGTRLSRGALLFAGACLGFAVVARQTSALVAVAVVAALLAARLPWRAVAAGVVAGALPLALYDLVAFGDVFEQGYGAKAFGTPLLEGLYGILASPSRGLFVYSPFLLFAIPPLLRAWRERAPLATLLRGLGLGTLALVLVYAAYTEWWGGRVFGARFLTDAEPALFVALGAGIPRALPARIAFAATAAWSALLYSAGAFAYAQTPAGGGVWDTDRNVNVDPSPLFSWQDPQWLDVLRAAAAPGAREIAAVVLTLAVLATLLVFERVRAPARIRSGAP